MPGTLRVRLKRNVDSSYTIFVGVPLRDCPRRIAKTFPASMYIVITDSNVASLYGRKFVQGLRSAGAKATLIIVRPGEGSKSRAMKSRIEDRIFSLGADRDSMIVALGGGVIGDLAGFVAATLHRGIRFVQVPTTLLAQVDSSVGGKVGIDHPKGKNLIGAFYQPEAVYIDPDSLRTLPPSEFLSGLAEVVKYGAILDRRFFAFIERRISSILNRDRRTLTAIISRCCELKMRVVQKDEKELSYRRILNFGHTIGHAVESASQFRIRHGHAVAIGMFMEAGIAAAKGLLPARDRIRLENLLDALGLPTRLPRNMGKSSLVRRTRFDKKMKNGKVRFTLLESIGRGKIDVPLNEREILRLIAK